MLITLAQPPSDAEIDAWHAVISAAHVRDLPAAVPEPNRSETAGKLRVPPFNGREVHLAAVAEDGTYEGVASLLLWTEPPNQHAAYLHKLVVDPGARRRGVGALLWGAIRERLAAEGRTSVSTRLELGGAGEAFVDSLGFVKMLPLTRYVQRVEQARASTPRLPLPEGLRFAHWTGVAPDELAGSLAEAHNALVDAPSGDLAARPPHWDEQRVTAAARLVGERGGVLVTTAAIDTRAGAGAGTRTRAGGTVGAHGADSADSAVGVTGGAVVAYTEAVLHTPEDSRAATGGTVVLPGHRGRGVGRAVKRHLLDVLHDEHPQVREIVTSVADGNGAMLAVNESLGYRRERPAGLFEMKV
ncbi:GNAT family N-acetyltransferase [Streptomyces montanisoli]|uniref:GNAT family N-acetyltransferase n=1 Tax=Streptomyces montanisoli TaxID=2798581 RepID=A0A940RZ36_9ACTN|nr:GNAT family N-acetyltransferase [Streptomyces montanisoli]MBP0459848.1 GNAT family N-acetyltransferase [Streptomyces montanisoli]